jgi:hypothetical protein
MADNADLLIYQGDDYSAVVNVTSGSTPPSQVLAGYTALAQIRRGVADHSDVVLTIAASVNSPYINLFISHADTTNLSGGYFWGLQLTDANGYVTTILTGKVQVTSEVTR